MLISTGTVRTWLDLPDGDKGPNTQIQSLIYSIQDFADSYTCRKLEAKLYKTDPENCYYDGYGTRWIYTKQYPLSSVAEVMVDNERDFAASAEIVADDYYFYPSGKIRVESGYFSTGRRNVRLEYVAGYAPVVGGTHDSAVSTYPCPYDLQQTMIEMVTMSFKEGLTAIHNVAGGEERGVTGDRFQQMLTKNSFWRRTLNKYRNYSVRLEGRGE